VHVSLSGLTCRRPGAGMSLDRSSVHHALEPEDTTRLHVLEVTRPAIVIVPGARHSALHAVKLQYGHAFVSVLTCQLCDMPDVCFSAGRLLRQLE
jgi:hypothetical protein